MKLSTRNVLVAIAASLGISGCGGGGGGGGNTSAPRIDSGNNLYRIHSAVTSADAKRSPIYFTGNLIRVGVDQGPGPSQLPALDIDGIEDVGVRYGTIRDGASAADLKEYLASVNDQYTGLSRRLSGYQVRVIGLSTAEEKNRVLAAVQLVNAALPENAKLSVGSPLPGFSLRDTVDSDGLYYGANRELPNTIHVEFGPEGTYDDSAAATSWGEYILLERGDFPAYTDQRNAVILMAHELIHSLGLGGHVPDRFDSIMEAGSGVYASSQRQRQPGSLLYPIDREALRALYGPLINSTNPEDLGPWSASSEHYYIDSDYGAFGVARRNGYSEPWVYGINPQTDLASNSQLSGSVTWDGVLVGFTPSAGRVFGETGIAVNLTNMNGSAAFTSLMTIEASGATSRWRDGDLHYSIAVRGNTFRETGGDSGRLTGIFAGRSHEAAGGTLERSDLTAAFGATRDQ